MQFLCCAQFVQCMAERMSNSARWDYLLEGWARIIHRQLDAWDGAKKTAHREPQAGALTRTGRQGGLVVGVAACKTRSMPFCEAPQTGSHSAYSKITVQEARPQIPVEALTVAVLPPTAWLDEECLHSCPGQPAT
jgi:hypothetical protein